MRSAARVPVHQGFQNFIDHPEMVVPLVLLLYVDEILVERIETARQQPGNMEAGLSGGFQKGARVFDDGEGARFESANGGGVRGAKQRGHFAEDGTGQGRLCDPHFITQDFHFTLDENEQQSRAVSLFEDNRPGIEVADAAVGYEVEYVGHREQITIRSSMSSKRKK